MHYYIISGELSGDLYGSHIIRSLRELNSNSRFTGWGGPNMKSTGCNMVMELDALSFMGFWEVFKNIFLIAKNLSFAKKNIKESKPDAIILIDYPGFNLRIAKYAHRLNIPVYWFIAPQLWAWKKNRINKLKKYVHRLFVALPFELNYFQQRGVSTFYFGHPLLDIINKQYDDKLKLLGKPIIVLLPGSREQEIKRMLPLMLKVIKYFPNYRFVIICSENISRTFYNDLVGEFNVELKFDKKILQLASGALVTSGTATLELALYKIPQVVCYKLDYFSFLIARFFIKIKYISLVNILSKECVVQELIQNDLNVNNIKNALSLVLQPSSKEVIIEKYNKLISELGESGSFDKLAQNIHSDLSGIKNHINI
jgi:lipid-A-disaccharide synthase